MGMPDSEAERFKDAVEWAARDVYRKWGKVFTLGALISEAWVIAAERWEGWGTTGMARTDARLRLFEYVAAQLPSKGFVRRQVDGERKWRREYWAVALNDARRYSANDDEIAWRLADALLPPLTEAEGLRFARIILDHYDYVAADFLALSEATKPRKMAHAHWERQQEKRRADLRIKYAIELMTALRDAL